jgi:hypothetical protein
MNDNNERPAPGKTQRKFSLSKFLPSAPNLPMIAADTLATIFIGWKGYDFISRRPTGKIKTTSRSAVAVGKIGRFQAEASVS